MEGRSLTLVQRRPAKGNRTQLQHKRDLHHDCRTKYHVTTATCDELLAFRTKAVEVGLSSLATGALVGWEWLQRVEDIFATFSVEHYQPKDYPNMVRVIDEKTRTES